MDNAKKRIHWKSWILGLLAIVLTCLYPCVFLFAQNAGEANASDILPFFLLFLATALAVFLVCGVIVREVSRAAVLTCLGMLAIINFSMITDAVKRQFPWFQDKFFLVFVAVILLGLLVLFLRKKPNLTAVCGIIALTFGVLTVMSIIQAVPRLIQTASYRDDRRSSSQSSQDVVFSGEKRNVYYLLFDEYGGDENLETYFEFDNSPFYEALEERGFSISHTSRNTDSCWTDTLVPNLMNLDYVVDDSMPEKIRREYLREPLLTRIFASNGYQINLINHRAYLRMEEARELTRGQTEDNISEYLFRNSIYCKIPLVKDKITRWMFEDYRDNYRGPLENAFHALKTCYKEAQDTPTLTVSYIQCPHAPFVYNADGSIRNLDTGWFWKDESLYPGQLQYLNTIILETIDQIQANDPNAVILLQSDHGARVPLHMVEQFGGPRFDAEKETPIMQSTLCCVYIPGQKLEIEGDTCINATRKTIDAVFGTSLGTIPAATGYVLDEIYNAAPHPEPETEDNSSEEDVTESVTSEQQTPESSDESEIKPAGPLKDVDKDEKNDPKPKAPLPPQGPGAEPPQAGPVGKEQNEPKPKAPLPAAGA